VPNATLINLIIVGLLNGLILLLSILIHELSHSLIAQRYGLKVSEIELYLFGGVSKIEEEPRTPGSEFFISIVGPFSSLIIGAILLILLYKPLNLPTFILVTFFFSDISNIGLGIFNLLPAFPIDGGRILRAYLWKRRKNLLAATKTASKIGIAFGYGLMIYGLFQTFIVGLLNGIWLILMGSFLSSSARQSNIQTRNEFTLSNINAREMLNIPNFAIPFDILVSDAVRDYFITYKKPYFPVIQHNSVVGIVHIKDIGNIPVQERNRFTIGQIMRNILDLPSIDETQSGKEALKRLKNMSVSPHIIVVKDKNNDNLLGFISEEDLISALKYWRLQFQNS